MMNSIKTTCPYCGVGCGVVMTPGEDGCWKVKGDRQHSANLGRLCSKGSALAETLDWADRSLQPMVAGQPESWDVALDKVAGTFRSIIEEHGPDAVAFYVSGQLLTEEYYVANKLMKGFIGSGNIDTNSRLCMSSSVAGHKRAFGSDSVPGCYEDLELADLIVLTGSNTAWCHPVIYQRIVKAKKDRPEMRVVVIDPRATPTCDVADLHLPLAPGTDSILYLGLLAALERQNQLDYAYITAHTEGLESALQQARWLTPSTTAVAELCGLSVAQVEAFYALWISTEKTVTVYSQGINQTSSGVDKVNAIINCHLASGRIGKPGQGPFSLTGQPNAMGGREVGALANQLAAHMDFSGSDVDRVSRFWGSSQTASKPGQKAVDLFRAIEEGRIKAVWIMATNPAVSMPDAGRVRRALESCEFVVVSEALGDTDTACYADVLLPALTWGEKDGTVTNSERRISRQRKFIEGPGEAKEDWWMLSQVAQRMGFSGFDFTSPESIFREHAALSGFENAGTRGFDISAWSDISTADYLAMEPFQWPSTSASNTTQRRFADGQFDTQDGKAQIITVIPRPPVNSPDHEYPLVLNTGRVRDHWHTMSRTGKSPRLSGHISEPFASVHPSDAGRTGIEDGQLLKVHSRWGTAILRASVTETQQKGQVFAPMHWNNRYSQSGLVNPVVNPATDPISGQPEFKHTPVRIEPYSPSWHGFIVSRRQLTLSNTSYWSRALGKGFWLMQIAGEQAPENWAAHARSILCDDGTGVDWLELFDDGAGIYRAARLQDDKLESAIFVSRSFKLPPKDWIATLFGDDEISQRDRNWLLSGKPAPGEKDVGRTICSCFGVGVNTITEAIARQNLQTPEAIGELLQAGTNCGSCVPELRMLIEAQATAPAA